MTLKKASLITLLTLLAAALMWWFVIRKQFLKDKIRQAVGKNTERLYRLTYDSLSFNEVLGNATFYNLQLQVDSSVLKRIITYDTIPNSLAHVAMKSLEITGLKSLDLLSGNALDVDRIVLRAPRLTLTKFTTGDTTKIAATDTLELYKTILGKYSFIHAKSIEITGGNFDYSDKEKGNKVLIEGVNIAISNFKIDSLHKYNTLVSYFIKDAVVSSRKALLVNDKDAAKEISIQSMYYNAAKGVLSLDSLKAGDKTVGNIAFNGLNTSDFILHQKFNTRKLTVTNVALSIKQKEKKNNTKAGDARIEIPGMLSAVKVDSFQLVNGNLAVKKEGKTVTTINGINASVNNIVIDDKGLNAGDYFTNTSFTLSIGNCRLIPLKGFHTININNTTYNYKNRQLNIASLIVQPTITKAQLATEIGVSKDMFYINAKNIVCNNINLKTVLFDNAVKASSVNAVLDMTVYNDKTLRMDSVIKEGKYPQQQITKANIEIDIPEVTLTNSKITYSEKAKSSALVGNVFFTDVNATIKNIHNKNALQLPLTVDIAAKFLGTGALKTKWVLPYGTPDGNFVITGTLGKMNLVQLNKTIGALSLARVNSGINNSLDFNIEGHGKGSSGHVQFNYNNLNVTLLKKLDKDSLADKKTASALANFIVKNKNNGQNKQQYVFNRDMYKSFFNLLWKSIFEGVKKTVL